VGRLHRDYADGVDLFVKVRVWISLDQAITIASGYHTGCRLEGFRILKRVQRPNLIRVVKFNAPIRRTSIQVSLSGNRSMISVFESPSLMPENHSIKLPAYNDFTI
jgi:hypothetical protein